MKRCATPREVLLQEKGVQYQLRRAASARKIVQEEMIKSPFRPLINKSPRRSAIPVEKRLLKKGKEYQIRRDRAKERSDLEELQQIKVTHIKRRSNNFWTTNVEDRLLNAKVTYEARRDKLKRELMEDELSELSNPSINLSSSKLKREGKVEDRLIEEGNRSKWLNERVKENIEARCKEDASPKITRSARKLQSSTKVPDRLLRYKIIYDIKKEDLGRRMDPQRSFSPNINNRSREIVKEKADKFRRSVSRSRSRSPSVTQIPQTVHKSFSFHPRINEKSRKLAEAQGPSESRILNTSSSPSIAETPEDIYKYSYTPKLNPRSQVLGQRNFVDETGRSVERTDLLYAMKDDRDVEIQRLLQKYRPTGVESMTECTFSPKISQDQMQTPRKQKQVESRLADWAQYRHNRIKDLRDSALEKERSYCSFTPKTERYTPSPKPEEKKGTQAFLERQILGRLKRDISDSGLRLRQDTPKKEIDESQFLQELRRLRGKLYN